MIAEEYLFTDIEEYLYNNNDLLIVGEEREEERTSFFIDLSRIIHATINLLKSG